MSNTTKRVLAIGAHPDDVEIGCGGALAKHRAQDDHVMILVLSGGARGGSIEIRNVEGQRAADLIGAEISFFDLPDTNISEGGETIEAVLSVVRRFNPTHVYTHSLHDTHQDHRSVHRATLVAARHVPNLYCYQAPSATVDFRPTRFVDVTRQMDKKLALIATHKSQTETRANLESDLIVATARFWGRFAGYCLAEPMEIIRQVD